MMKSARLSNCFDFYRTNSDIFPLQVMDPDCRGGSATKSHKQVRNHPELREKPYLRKESGRLKRVRLRYA